MNKRAALVTGSTSGIGRAIANQLALEGFSVVFHSRSSVEEGQRLALQNENASYIQADLSNQAESKSLIEKISSRYGRLDVLVNNAALTEVIDHSNLKAATPEIWRMLHEVNVIAPGLVHTPMSKDWTAARELWRNKAPMKRGAQPEEIAYVAGILINSSYLTGEIVLADGGLNLT